MNYTFFKSTLIILISTIITKILGFIIRTIFIRIIGDGISIYSLILPTYSLLIAITELGLPYAISCIIARKKYRGKEIISTILPLVIIFNLIIIFILIITSKYIAINLLKNNNLYYPLISISLILPFASISGILKGYFYGKQNMIPSAISNIIEQIIRLLLVTLIISKTIQYSLILSISLFILITGFAELIQIIIYIHFLPKKIKINYKLNKKIAYDIFSISIPSTTSRIIGNIEYFLEPIILTNILILVGYTNDFISTEYGIYTMYVIPILTIPLIITNSVSTSLIPEISKNYNNKNIIRKRLLSTILITLSIGICYCFFIYFKSDLILNILYKTNKGINYIKILSIIFPIFYIEGPLISIIQALNESKYILFVSIISSIIKILITIILSLFKIGIYSLIIAEICHIITVISLCFKKLKVKNYI